MSNENQEKIHLSVETVDGEITIRHGAAAPIIQKTRLSLSGTILAPADWVAQKLEASYPYFNDYCHVVVDRDHRTIKFVSNDEGMMDGGHTITGQLEDPTALRALHINTNRTYSAKQLGDLLKMNRSLFTDRDENLATVTALQRFKATVTQEMEKNDDLSGNKLYHFEQRVQSEFNLGFMLSTPIFKGQPTQSFRVEIRYDVADGGVSYWLESVKLKDLQDTQSDRIIEAEIARLRAAGMPTIEK